MAEFGELQSTQDIQLYMSLENFIQSTHFQRTQDIQHSYDMTRTLFSELGKLQSTHFQRTQVNNIHDMTCTLFNYTSRWLSLVNGGQMRNIPLYSTTCSIKSCSGCPCPTLPCTLIRLPNGLWGGKVLGKWTPEATLTDHLEVVVFPCAKTWPRRRITFL